MKAKKFCISFSITFVLVFILNAAVMYIYNLLKHSEGKIEWQTALFFAVIMAIVVSLLDFRKKKS